MCFCKCQKNNRLFKDVKIILEIKNLKKSENLRNSKREYFESISDRLGLVAMVTTTK